MNFLQLVCIDCADSNTITTLALYVSPRNYGGVFPLIPKKNILSLNQKNYFQELEKKNFNKKRGKKPNFDWYVRKKIELLYT